LILYGDALTVLKTLESKSVNMCVTSPPYYGLRDYGVDGQIGLEDTPEQYIARLVDVFREVRRVLRDDGTLWLNIGDSYAGSGKGGSPAESKWNGFVGNIYREAAAKSKPQKAKQIGLKPKDLIGIPWMLAFALRADGWYLRQDIIWHKPNPMPESVRDRCTKSHEYIFLLSKSGKYYYDREPIREPVKKGCDGTIRAISRERSGPVDVGNGAHISERVYNEIKGANKRSVWTVATKPFKDAHFATFPPSLITPCILAGCPEGGIVLDPFFGSGTTGEVAAKLMRKWIGIELNPKYIEIAERRTAQTALANNA
jgi:DNA modification methylase